MQSQESGVFQQDDWSQREDWTLFRTLAGCAQMAGVPASELGRVVAKELTDNALDAGGSCRMGMLADGGFFVHDDGGGIPGSDQDVATLFSVGRPLTSTKLKRLPTRGALGNGLRVVAGAVLASQGALIVRTKGRSLRLTPRDDGATAAENLGPWEGTGTCVEASLGQALRDDSDLLVWAEQAGELAGTGKPYRGRSSARWYDEESFGELLRASRGRTVRDVVSDLQGCGREKAAAACGRFLGRAADGLTRAEAAEVLSSARRISGSVRPELLGCVGRLDRFTGYSGAVTGAFPLNSAREGGAGCEIPYVVEAWAVESNTPDVTVCVNRTPVTASVSVRRDGTQGSTDYAAVGCNLCHRFKVGRGRNFSLLVNVLCPYMPVTSHGKAPDLEHIVYSLVAALEAACRRAQKGRRAKVMSQKALVFGALPAAIDKVSGGGRTRYSLRQLFYAVRPLLVAKLQKEPDYGTFGKIITAYEDEVLNGADLNGIYRDNRGVLYHPHIQEEIPLGTRTVEIYRRPEWTFNKILYCEKEGFFPMLIDAGWPERNDCALLTSKGFATRAGRDVLDLLAQTGEELLVFCIHDADGPGTLIYEKLYEATKARKARKVQVVNLGLEPEVALAMGLVPERVKRKDSKAVCVGSYVESHWRDWLQSNRVEMNEMTSPQFIAWLDRKFEPYQGKLVPPLPVMVGELASRTQEKLRKRITEEILRRAGFEGQVAAAGAALATVLERRGTTLGQVVSQVLRATPEKPWNAPVADVAAEIVASLDSDAPASEPLAEQGRLS